MHRSRPAATETHAAPATPTTCDRYDVEDAMSTMAAATVLGVSLWGGVDRVRDRAAHLYDAIPAARRLAGHAYDIQMMIADLAARKEGEDAESLPPRQRAIRAVKIQHAIVDLAVREGREDLAWLREALDDVGAALAELERGIVPPLMAPSPRSPRHGRENDYDQRVKSLSAMACERLARLRSISEAEAARAVSKFLRRRRLRAHPRSVRNWLVRWRDGDLPIDMVAWHVFRGCRSAESVCEALDEGLIDAARRYVG
jgi:hypothetical protein